jgi:hypothetical protein
MASKKPTETEQAAASTAITKSLEDQLAEFSSAGVFDQIPDGIEVDPNDIRIPRRLLNQGGDAVDGDGAPVRDEYYYDKLAQKQYAGIRCVFLAEKKIRIYSNFDKQELICRSSDRITGMWQATQTKRPCKGCEFAKWVSVDGKRKVACDEIYRMYAKDLDTGELFTTTYKRTSLQVLRNYQQRFHIGQLRRNGIASNLPLCTFEVQLGATIVQRSKTSSYAVPTITRVAVASVERIRDYAAEADVLQRTILPLMNEFEIDDVAPKEDDDQPSTGGYTPSGPAREI